MPAAGGAGPGRVSVPTRLGSVRGRCGRDGGWCGGVGPAAVPGPVRPRRLFREGKAARPPARGAALRGVSHPGGSRSAPGPWRGRGAAPRLRRTWWRAAGARLPVLPPPPDGVLCHWDRRAPSSSAVPSALRGGGARGNPCGSTGSDFFAPLRMSFIG